jgi:hypothetical protein
VGEVLHDSLNQWARCRSCRARSPAGSSLGRSVSKMQLEARATCQPALYDRISMGGVAVVKKFRPSIRAVKVVQR